MVESRKLGNMMVVSGGHGMMITSALDGNMMLGRDYIDD